MTKTAGKTKDIEASEIVEVASTETCDTVTKSVESVDAEYTNVEDAADSAFSTSDTYQTESVEPRSKVWLQVDDCIRTYALNTPTGCVILTNVGITYIPNTKYDEESGSFCR